MVTMFTQCLDFCVVVPTRESLGQWQDLAIVEQIHIPFISLCRHMGYVANKLCFPRAFHIQFLCPVVQHYYK